MRLGDTVQVQVVEWREGRSQTVWKPATVIHLAPNAIGVRRLEDGVRMAFTLQSWRWREMGASACRTP